MRGSWGERGVRDRGRRDGGQRAAHGRTLDAVVRVGFKGEAARLRPIRGPAVRRLVRAGCAGPAGMARVSGKGWGRPGRLRAESLTRGHPEDGR